MTEFEYSVVECMDNFGGSFVKSLAQCFYHADRINIERLKDAFPDYWKEYSKMAKEDNK